jgi:hypothetical protein
MGVGMKINFDKNKFIKIYIEVLIQCLYVKLYVFQTHHPYLCFKLDFPQARVIQKQIQDVLRRRVQG